MAKVKELIDSVVSKKFGAFGAGCALIMSLDIADPDKAMVIGGLTGLYISVQGILDIVKLKHKAKTEIEK